MLAVFGNYLVGGEAKERALHHELIREREFSTSYRLDRAKLEAAADKPKRLEAAEEVDRPAVRLTGDGEFTESFVEEINNGEGQQRGN